MMMMIMLMRDDRQPADLHEKLRIMMMNNT